MSKEQLNATARFWNIKANAIVYEETGDYNNRIARARVYFQRAKFYSDQALALDSHIVSHANDVTNCWN